MPGVRCVATICYAMLCVLAWTEQFPESPRDQCRKQHQIPVTHKLPPEDFQHLAGALVAKLGKHRRCGALAREGEIHAIHQVDVHGDAVDDRIYPSCHTIVARALFPVQRQQEHQQDDGIGVEDGGRVKQQSGAKQFHRVAKRQRAGIHGPVECQERGAAQRVGAIDDQQIPQECRNGQFR